MRAGHNDANALLRGCLVFSGFASSATVRVELRRRVLNDWRDATGTPISTVILDATGADLLGPITAAHPGREVRLFEVAVPDAPSVSRVHLSSRSLTKTKMFEGRSGARLSATGVATIIRVIRAALRRAEDAGARQPRVGIVSHMAVASIIDDCLSLLLGTATDGAARRRVAAAGAEMLLAELERLNRNGRLGRIDVLHFGNQKGSNKLEAVDLLLVIGDPWADIDAAREDASALGLDPDQYITALMNAETTQALGRARAVRRTEGSPVLLAFAGMHRPTAWRGQLSETIPVPGGLPASGEAEDGASLMHSVSSWLGAVSPALISRLAADPQLYQDIVLADQSSINTSFL